MKKIFLALVFVFGSAAFVTSMAANTTGGSNNDVQMQVIITDCGTEHQIPANSTKEAAEIAVNYWNWYDCGGLSNPEPPKE